MDLRNRVCHQVVLASPMAVQMGERLEVDSARSLYTATRYRNRGLFALQ